MSDIPQFGVTLVGKRFEWSELVECNEDEYGDCENGMRLVVHEFRARSGITFDESLEYRVIQSRMASDSELLAKHLREHAERIDGQEDQSIDDLRGDIDALAKMTEEHERTRWTRMIEQCLLLTHPPHRERLCPLLEAGDVAGVTNLRAWLRAEVLGPPVKEAEEVGNVDPTLPPPPPDSASNEDGGPTSGETESPSTD